jgi:hypothetical protein
MLNMILCLSVVVHQNVKTHLEALIKEKDHLASKCKAMEQGIKLVLDLISTEPKEAPTDRPTSLTRGHRREVPELLDLVQTIHLRRWRVRGCPRVRRGAVTLA